MHIMNPEAEMLLQTEVNAQKDIMSFGLDQRDHRGRERGAGGPLAT